MNRKRSNETLPQSKRLKTPSITQTLHASHFNAIPRTPTTSDLVHADCDGPLESSTTPPFSVGNRYHDVVFPSETSIPPLSIQGAHAVISSTSVRPSMHQVGDRIQDREVLYGADSKGFKGDYCQHDPRAGDTRDNANGDSFPEGLPESSISQGDREAQDDRPEISNEDSRSQWKTVLRSAAAEVYNILHTQPRHIESPSEPLVTQFPVQSHMFQSAQMVDISGNAKFKNIGKKVTNVFNHLQDGTHGLEEMKSFVSFSAQFDSSAQDPERVCHPGTRQNVLNRINNWIDNPTSAERIIWLHGPAGAGKSAIAQTIAQSCGRQKVPATFFFFRSDSARNNGNILFTTLAYQLAFSMPVIKDHIAHSLHERPDLPTKGVEIQFNDLIAQPFRSLTQVASARLSPVSIIDAVNQCQQLSPVIIIDGVDECMGEKLQERFLKIIGNAVKDRPFPFRFLICSRPEAHIEDTLNKLKALILPIDLAKLDDANRDIEKYLMEQFSSIASNRGLDLSWPGREVIRNIVYKSSGNFIFASVVIKVVGDEDSMPEDQLAIILNLKPPDKVSPFAVLDELFLEILRRQRHQDFLKTCLALLVGRTSLSYRSLNQDDAKLMNVSEKELHTKLRRMRSLLKIEPHIDVHHRSFLDFLYLLSRSGDYHVSDQAGARRYVELVVDAIVRHISTAIEKPDYHETHHLSLEFRDYLILHSVSMPSEELKDILQPLVQVQEEFLKLGDSRVVSNLLSCNKCNVFYIMHTLLLHLPYHQCIDAACNQVEESVSKGRYPSVIASPRPEEMESLTGNDLDSSLSLLLTLLQNTKLELLPSMTIINHTYAILHFDCAKVAVKLRSISDAQRLVDLLVDLMDKKYILSQYQPDAMSKAARLVLMVFSRIPVLPRSLILNVKRITSNNGDFVKGIGLLCKAALLWRVLDKDHIHLEMGLQEHSLVVPYNNSLRSEKWRQVLPLDSSTVIEVVLDLARAIQHLHSMGVTPGNLLEFRHVYLHLSLRPRIRIATEFLTIINPVMGSETERSSYEASILAFGHFFYAVYFNIDLDTKSTEERNRIIAERPTSPKIPEYAWKLIQRCCPKDPKTQPTIDEVVKEMETWSNQPT